MKIELMNKSKKEDFLEQVSYLGEFKVPYLFLKNGREMVRAYSGHLLSDEIMKIWRSFPIEGVGLYFGKESIDKHGNKEARLSLDALHIVKDKISKNIVDLDKEQALRWFKGENVELNPEQKENYKSFKNFVAIRFNEEFIGTAKLNGAGILVSFLPKERRIRN